MKLRLRKNRFSTGVEIGRNTKASRDSHIGPYSYIDSNCVVSKARIGAYVSIADNISIGSGENDISRVSTSSIFFYEDRYTQLTSGNSSVDSDVWNGADAIVRRGVSIGFGAVIGANSFVNKDVPPFGIVAGSPARLLGYRFSEEAQNAILASEWWAHVPNLAKQIISDLERNLGEALKVRVTI